MRRPRLRPPPARVGLVGRILALPFEHAKESCRFSRLLKVAGFFHPRVVVGRHEPLRLTECCQIIVPISVQGPPPSSPERRVVRRGRTGAWRRESTRVALDRSENLNLNFLAVIFSCKTRHNVWGTWDGELDL